MATKKAARPGASAPSRKRPAQATGGETHQTATGKRDVMTTAQGIPVSDNQNSLRAYPRGPTLLEDFVLREKITHFDHERIPDRIVHARGSAAHGYFELTHPLTGITTARLFTDKGLRVPVFTRFSTVAGGAGSVDTPRDVRGFAVKFYTPEGNYDLVGNNLPVFAIQDAMKFPDFIHAVKMEPDRGFPQAASAHDTFWDFVSLSPETLNMVMWAMSDRGIPRSLRMIEGFGIHSFRFFNEAGDSTFVRFHWRPRLGLQSLVWDESAKLQGADNDFHRRDLFDAINAGQYPEWDLAVQLFTEDEADAFPFDHLDATKLIPEELVPLRVVGRMVLDRNPDNHFAENDQVAFCPANLVPGIDFSNDPLLQGRLFSYLDTQLWRLGGPNFTQIPVNAPKCPFANHQRDAHMQMQVPKGRVAYEPASLDKDGSTPNGRETPAGFRSFAERAPDDGRKGRLRAESFADHYSQPRLFWNSQSDVERAHIASALVFELAKVEDDPVRERTVGQLRNIDQGLAQRVADGLGMKALPAAEPAAVPAIDMPPSPALALIGKMKDTLEGRCIGILVAEGSDGKQVDAIRSAAEKAGAIVKIVAPKLHVAMKGGKPRKVDGQLAGTPSLVFDAVASVLDPAEAEKLAKDGAAIDWFRDAFGHLKAIAACGGTRQHILKAAGIKPDAGVVEPGDVKGFIKLAKTRQWAREPRLRTLA
ncbi:catalase HPII [Lysobacter oculi]|uniref:Catalase n=1 Tax=Solilutibacter oculi TaxID=2698682 RepID=A0A344J5G0_9GAMM|nr:catalase [Lysobacter oculi]AXA84270.1 catalase HPII [Lysobacter oculi]